MSKTFKDRLPFEKIRIPVPKPGRAMPTEKDYNRKREKRVVITEEDEEE